MIKKNSKKKQQITKSWGERLWEGNRKWFTLTPACLLVIGAGWYAYVSLTVIPPPVLEKSTPEDFVRFVTSEQGIARMPVEQRLPYLTQAWQYYGNAPIEQQRMLVEQLSQLSVGQREVLRDATFQVAKAELLKQARQYQQISTGAGRAEFMTQSANQFQQMKNELTGVGKLAPGLNVAAPLAQVVPQNDGEVQRMVMTQTTAGERAVAEPYINDMVQQHKMAKANGQGASGG